MNAHNEATSAIVTVSDGRGFVVQTANGDRVVITRAHCLQPFRQTQPVAACRRNRTPIRNSSAPWRGFSAECKPAENDTKQELFERAKAAERSSSWQSTPRLRRSASGNGD